MKDDVAMKERSKVNQLLLCSNNCIQLFISARENLPTCSIHRFKIKRQYHTEQYNIYIYIADRRGLVKFETTNSKTKRFNADVPQGAVLSPTLFIPFINDIVKDLLEDVKVSLFADDLAI